MKRCKLALLIILFSKSIYPQLGYNYPVDIVQWNGGLASFNRTGNRMYHTGTDFYGDQKATIKAVNSGIVTKICGLVPQGGGSERFYLWNDYNNNKVFDSNEEEGPIYSNRPNRNNHRLGMTIIIQHSDGKYSLYGHLDNIKKEIYNKIVVQNSTYSVQKGEAIGLMGFSEYNVRNDYNIHLHFELKEKNALGNIDDNSLYWGYTPDLPLSYGYYDFLSSYFPQTNNLPFVGNLKIINEEGGSEEPNRGIRIYTGPGVNYYVLGWTGKNQVFVSDLKTTSNMQADTQEREWYRISLPNRLGVIYGWVASKKSDGTPLVQIDNSSQVLQINLSSMQLAKQPNTNNFVQVWDNLYNPQHKEVKAWYNQKYVYSETQNIAGQNWYKIYIPKLYYNDPQTTTKVAPPKDNSVGDIEYAWVPNSAVTLINNNLNSFQLNLFSNLNLISFPILPSPSKFSDIFSSLGSNFLPYVFYVNDAGVLTYKEASQLDAIAKKGYFISLTNPASVNVQGYPTNRTLILRRGMNIVGVSEDVIPPFNSSVYKDAFYFGSNGEPQHTNMFVNGLQRGKGYFIFSDIDNNMLISDVTNIIAKQDNQKVINEPLIETNIDFACNVIITQNPSNTVQLKFGIKPGAFDGNDEFDVLRAIPSPGDLIGFFDDAFGYKESYKSYSSNKEWPLIVISPSEIPNNPPNLAPININWVIPSFGSLPPGSTVKLLDENRNVIVPNMLTTAQWNFTPSSASTVKKFFIQTFIPTQQGSTPIATTLNTTNISQTSAKVYGSFNPQGSETHVYFKYGLAAGMLTDSTNQVNIGSGTVLIEKNETLINLLPSTNFYYRAVAKNSNGYTLGEIKNFMTSITSGSPEVITLSASNVNNTSAQLNGTINPNGLNTTYYFEYGTTPQFGSASIPFDLEASNQYQDVNFTLAGLQPNQTYYYQVVAQNTAGTNYGGNVTFNTGETNQNTYWTQTGGPIGGAVYILFQTEDRMLAGTEAGIYISDNNTGIWSKSSDIRCVDFAKNNQRILYAAAAGVPGLQAPGIYRSTDNGINWYKIEQVNINCIAINSLNHIFFGNYQGIFRSTDNGNSWIQVFSGQDIGALNIDNLGNLYAGTRSTNIITMLRSTNNGVSWEPKNTGGMTNFNRIFIDNNNHVYAASLFGLIRSTDFGNTWIRLGQGQLPSASFYDIKSYNAKIYVSGEKGIYNSTDNGLTWNVNNSGLNTTFIYGLAITNNNLIYSCTRWDGIYRWSALLNKWEKINTGIIATGFTSIAHSTGGYIFAASKYGLGIFKSTNNGSDWLEVNLPDQVSKSINDLKITGDFVFITANANTNGINEGGIFRSTNLGSTWEKINQYESAVGLFALNNHVFCYIYAEQPKFLHSGNYGNSWEEYPLPEYSYISEITYKETSKLYAIISYKLHKSTNNGATWSEVPFNIRAINYESKIYISSDDILYLSIPQYGLYQTNNDGITWDSLNQGFPSEININAIGETDNFWMHELIVAAKEGYYKFDNTTHRWQINNDGLFENSPLWDFTINADGIVYLATERHGIFKNQYPINKPYQIVKPNGSEQLRPGDIYTIQWQSNGMGSSKLEYTTNNGNSWAIIMDSINASVGAFTWSIPNSPSTFCKVRISSNFNPLYNDPSDNNFTILPTTSVEEENQIYTYSLSQNFPNPFNPSTTIKFSLAESSPVSLKIYDILGKEVLTLVDEILKHGNYTYSINASQLASGIYIYRLIAGNFVSTKKLILLK